MIYIMLHTIIMGMWLSYEATNGIIFYGMFLKIEILETFRHLTRRSIQQLKWPLRPESDHCFNYVLNQQDANSCNVSESHPECGNDC